MAYLAFHDLGGALAARAMHVAAPRHDAVPGGLNGLERSVMALARRDGRATLRRPGRLTTMIDALLRRPNPRLADARLEALRRLAVLVRLDGDAVAADERRRFLAAGFTAGQYDALIAVGPVGRNGRTSSREDQRRGRG